MQVTTAEGCTASGKVVIGVFTNMAMPGAFTPNGDGINDVFRIPPSLSIPVNNFSIFDRWGNKIFSTTDAAAGWDGMYGGEQQPNGAYVWLLNFTDPIKKIPVQLNGTIILMR